jgi:hypothetical protein
MSQYYSFSPRSSFDLGRQQPAYAHQESDEFSPAWNPVLNGQMDAPYTRYQQQGTSDSESMDVEGDEFQAVPRPLPFPGPARPGPSSSPLPPGLTLLHTNDDFGIIFVTSHRAHLHRPDVVAMVNDVLFAISNNSPAPSPPPSHDTAAILQEELDHLHQDCFYY